MNKYEEIKNLSIDPKKSLTIIYREATGNIKLFQCTIKGAEPLEPNGVILTMHPKHRSTAKRKIEVQFYQELLIYDDLIEIDLNQFIYESEERKTGTYRKLKYDNYTSKAFYDIMQAHPNYLLFLPKE